MKKILIAGLFLFFTIIALNGQEITNEKLEEIRSSFKKDASTTAIQNILTTHKDIKDNALNHDVSKSIDHFFKYRVNVKGITNQRSSGRCWMFTSMNVIRPLVMQLYNIDQFDFSQNYLYFWDIFEKSNLFLENIIATSDRDMGDREVVEYFRAPIGDGGVWNLYYNVALKYGVVPDVVMPETEHSNNTSQLLSIVREKLRMSGYQIREMAIGGKSAEELRTEKESALKDIYRVLALCLGEPPTEFVWRYKNKSDEIKEVKYTPKQFYEFVTPADYSPENYIMVMNDPTREFYKVYEIQNVRNTVEGINWVYLNLPVEDIKKAALQSIKNNEAMYASCDVGKQHNRVTGVLDPDMYDYESLLGIKLNMDKKARILTRQSGSTHAMALIGCDTDENGRPVKWEFENSWGPASGNKGYLTFTDRWFDEYMFRLVVHLRYLDIKAINALKQTPVQLPVWDYMN